MENTIFDWVNMLFVNCTAGRDVRYASALIRELDSFIADPESDRFGFFGAVIAQNNPAA